MSDTPLIRLCDELADNIIDWYEEQVQKKYIMHDIYNQLLRSATSIGANVAESQFSQSPADYKSKMHIALKEASETRYWIKHLTRNESINSELAPKLSDILDNIINILISVTNNS